MSLCSVLLNVLLLKPMLSNYMYIYLDMHKKKAETQGETLKTI